MSPRPAGPPDLVTLRADVLVIGGGFAGCFAAIKAAEAGADVVMAVKGRAGRSGLTPWANSWFVFEDTRGVSRDDYLRQFVLSGEYLANMGFVDALMTESYRRYLEISEWGARTGRSHYYQPGTVTRSIEVVDSGDAMRRKAVAAGVHLLERVMVTELLKPDDRVVGAVGFHVESGSPHAVLAGATVNCSNAPTTASRTAKLESLCRSCSAARASREWAIAKARTASTRTRWSSSEARAMTSACISGTMSISVSASM